MKARLLLVLLVAALVSAVAYAAKAPVNADEPITMTKGMYADLLCMAASEFDPGKGGIQYNLSPGTRVIKLVKARSGHLLVPCCEWATAKASSSAPGKAHVFVCEPSE